MPDQKIQDIEKLSEFLKSELASIAWPELKIVILHEHLRLLLQNCPQSYYLPDYFEVIQHLNDALNQIQNKGYTGTGIPPFFFLELIKDIETCRQIGDEDKINEMASHTGGCLRTQLIQSYFRLLDFKSLHDMIIPPHQKEKAADVSL